MTMRSRNNRRWQEMEKGNFHLGELARYYETYNRSEGKSPATIQWHQETLKVFIGWLTENQRPDTLGSINEQVVREFILALQAHRPHGHEIKVSSVNNRVRSLRAFFNWLYHMGYTESHLLQNIKPPRIPKTMVDTLTEEETARIIAGQDQSTATGSRNVAMLALFLDAGLRISELVNLKINDVHIEENYVKVMGKGSKERMVAFGNATRNALLRYLLHFRGEPAHAGIEAFFLTIDGYSTTRGGLISLIRRIGDSANVSRLHAHLCRHSYATNFLIAGGNVLLLKQNLGHTTLAMVDCYVHLTTSKVAVLSRDFSQLDKMSIPGLRRGPNKRNDGVKLFHRK